MDIGGKENNLLDSIDLLKPAVEKLSELELVQAGISISLNENGLDVSSASVMIGLREIDWEVIKDVLTIESAYALFDIRRPFGDLPEDELSHLRGPRVDVTIMGTVSIRDKRFDWTATTRDSFTVQAKLARGQEILLTDLIEDCAGSGRPSLGPNLKIDYLAISASPKTGDYTFAGRLKSEPKLEIIAGFALSEVAVRLERRGGDMLGEVCAVLNIADVDLYLKAKMEPTGWQFDGRTGPGQKIPIGKLVADLAKKFKTDRTAIPKAIETLVFQDLAVSFNTGQRKRFWFSGDAKLEVDGTPYGISVTVELADNEGNGKYQKGFAGSFTYGGAEFKFGLLAGDAGTELDARWKKGVNLGRLDPGTMSNSADLSELQSLLLPPVEASLKLKLGDDNKVIRLALACAFENGAHAAFLLTRESGDGPARWNAALGLKPPKISTKSLGPLGRALEPHNISLDKLVIVAASADGSEVEQLTLAGQSYPVSTGLFLSGALEFEGTSFTAPFECRLGGDPKPKALPAGIPRANTPATKGAATSPLIESAKTEAELEVKNNVAVGRTIGPVTFRKARLESRDKRVYVLLDASLGSGGFALDLTGFSLNFPLTLLQDPVAHASEISVGLDGLSIAYSKPPLTISGGFARTTAVKPYVDYRVPGLRAGQGPDVPDHGDGLLWQLLINNETKPALFLYGAFVGVLGGPPEFFVTGLAVGGGYNTRLALPPIEQVADFPLVQAVTHPAAFALGGMERLREKAVQPSYGDYWFAVGVKFNSFKMVDSFALFSVSFGSRLQFALLGLTKLDVPTGLSRARRPSMPSSAIRAVLDPAAGVFSIEGQPNRELVCCSSELRLTGGFAFFVWFGNAKEAGDFVISLGGYHPRLPAAAALPCSAAGGD